MLFSSCTRLDCYSVAEYCNPVWYHSAHTSLDDFQLYDVIRTVVLEDCPRPRGYLEDKFGGLGLDNTVLENITGCHKANHRINTSAVPSSVPWLPLPILCNFEAPAFRRKVYADKLLSKVFQHEEWSLHDDILHPARLRLLSRKPLWIDNDPMDICHGWSSASVVNHHGI